MRPSFTRLIWLLLLLMPLALAGRAHATPPALAPSPGVTLHSATAVWVRPGLARITWSSDAPLLCVGKVDAAGYWQFLSCERDQVEDKAPAAGDTYLILSEDTILARLPLVARVLLPVVAH